MEKTKWFTVAALIFFFGAILPGFFPSLDLFSYVGLSSDYRALLMFAGMMIVVWHGGVWKYLKGLTRGKIRP